MHNFFLLNVLYFEHTENRTSKSQPPGDVLDLIQEYIENTSLNKSNPKNTKIKRDPLKVRDINISDSKYSLF